MSPELVRQRSAVDVVLGVLLALVGLVILGNAVVATAVSISFLGWMALVIGVAQLIGALLRVREGHAWSSVLGGALLAVLGLLILRNPLAAALTLTLVAAALFLAVGVTRIALSFAFPQHRVVLLVGGIASAVLGVIVLSNVAEASFKLLGVLIGVQALVEGVTLLLLGRVRVRRREPPPRNRQWP